MANCQQVYDFLSSASARGALPGLAPQDLAALQQAQLIQLLSAPQQQELAQALQQAPASPEEMAERSVEAQKLSFQIASENQKTHSILFKLEGKDKQANDMQRIAQEQSALQQAQQALSSEQQQYNLWLSRRSLMSSLQPCGSSFVALTTLGLSQVGDLRVRLYRYGDQPFDTYWKQLVQTRGELAAQADRGGEYARVLSGPLQEVGAPDVWSVSLGLADVQPDTSQGAPLYLQSYEAIRKLSPNQENRLLTSEMLVATHAPLETNLPLLTDLNHEVHKMGVPKESALGVASVVLVGRRYDGSFATDTLRTTLSLSRSYETAALLAILNRPMDQITEKFNSLRTLFSTWGFQDSEDVELASAFLTCSELPSESIGTKLAIIAKGLSNYLAYPLVAASVLASIPVLEANETLNLLEHAYEYIAAKAPSLAQPELICLGVRMVKGIRNETLGLLDTTAAPVPTAAGAGRVGYYPRPVFWYAPIIIAHGSYYSTYSGIGGVHPAHVHAAGGFVG